MSIPTPMRAVGVGLPEAIAEVERALAAMKAELGEPGDDWAAYRARRHAAIDRMVPRLARAAGAAISNDWNGASIRCAGFRATSTSGVEGALNNWLVAARKRVAAL